MENGHIRLIPAHPDLAGAVADYYRSQGIDPTPIVGELTECEECACDAH